MKVFNEISILQQLTHLFKYPTIFKTTEFHGDVTAYSVSCIWLQYKHCKADAFLAGSIFSLEELAFY